MMIALLSIALLQQTAQQEAAQKASEDQLRQWVKDHPVELKQQMDRMSQIRALTYDQALVLYDQCLARSAAALDEVAPDEVFDRARRTCLPLRADLLNGRQPQWFLGFNDLDAAKRAAFPALTRQLRARLGGQTAAADMAKTHD